MILPARVSLIPLALLLLAAACAEPASVPEPVTTVFHVSAPRPIRAFTVTDLNTGDTLLFDTSERDTASFAVAVPHAILAELSVNDVSQRDVLLSPYGNHAVKLTATDSSLRSDDTLSNTLSVLRTRDFGFIQNHQSQLFRTRGRPEAIAILDTAKESGLRTIDSLITLSSADRDLLAAHHLWELHSFLYFLGRNTYEVPRGNDFYAFRTESRPDTATLFSLPLQELLSIETDYFSGRDTLATLSDFTDYVRSRHAGHPELGDLLVAYYLRDLVRDPAFWTLHAARIDPVLLDQLRKAEAGNSYRRVFDQPVLTEIELRTGKDPLDFYALDVAGDTVRIGDFRGSYVFVDFWATWCGPCIQQEPHFNRMVRTFDEEAPIRFLKLSVDAARSSWVAYDQSELPEHVADLWVDTDQQQILRNGKFLDGIPRYVLFGPDGQIVQERLPPPSRALGGELRSLIDPS